MKKYLILILDNMYEKIYCYLINYDKDNFINKKVLRNEKLSCDRTFTTNIQDLVVILYIKWFISFNRTNNTR